MTSRRMNAPALRYAILPSLFAVLVSAIPTVPADAGEYIHVRVDQAGKVLLQGAPPPSEYVYFNEQDPFEPNAVPQNGEEWADFLHCTHGGPLTGFGAGFDGAPTDSFDVTMTLYAAASAELQSGGSPGGVILGPWSFRVSHDTIGLSVSFGSFMTISDNLWFGVKFSDPSVGLTRNDPPSVGSSEDFFHNIDQDIKGDFAGNPVANFVMSVQVEGPVSVQPTTWGRIKTLIGSGN